MLPTGCRSKSWYWSDSSFSTVLWSAQALEMTVGKSPFVEAVNGSTVLLPCSYISCVGIKQLNFSWQYNNNGTMQKVSPGVTLTSKPGPPDPWRPVGLCRCVSQWYSRRTWCRLWRYFANAWSLWAITWKATFPSCCGTSPLRTEACTRVLGSTLRRRARITALLLSSSFWTSVSGRVRRGQINLDTHKDQTKQRRRPPEHPSGVFCA